MKTLFSLLLAAALAPGLMKGYGPVPPAVQADGFAIFFFASDGADDTAMATTATALTSKNCENDFM